MGTHLDNHTGQGLVTLVFITIIISVVSLAVAGFIFYRYNQFTNDYYDVIDETANLLSEFDGYKEVLAIIEQHDVIAYDPLISELVIKTKDLNDQINKSQNVLKDFLRIEK